MIIDDISLTFDLRNKIGIMNLIKKIIEHNEKLKIILLTHDFVFAHELNNYLLMKNVKNENISFLELYKNKNCVFSRVLKPLFFDLSKNKLTRQTLVFFISVIRDNYKNLDKDKYKELSNDFFHYSTKEINIIKKIDELKLNIDISKIDNLDENIFYDFLKNELKISDDYEIKNNGDLNIFDKLSISLFIRQSAEYEYYIKTKENLKINEILKKLDTSSKLFLLYQELNFYLCNYVHFNQESFYRIGSLNSEFILNKLTILKKIKELDILERKKDE